MFPRKKRIASVLSLGLVALVGGVAAVKSEPEALTSTDPVVDPVEVVVERVADGPLEAPVSLTGEVLAMRRTQIRAETNGRVLEMPLRIGERVEAGAILAHLDGSKNDLAIREARARASQTEIAFEQASRKLARSQLLFDSEKISVQQYEDSVFRKQDAEAALELRRAELAALARLAEDYAIRAPYDAYVTEIGIQVGDFVTAGAHAFSLVGTDGVKASFQVPAEHKAAFIRSDAHRVEVPALGLELEARIAAVAKEADARSRTFEVELDLPREADLRTGMIAKISADLETGRRGLFVPSSAVVEKFGGSFVFLVEDGRAREIPVSIEHRSDERVAPVVVLREKLAANLARP
jgi:RND family efflux transporter MFP subunit